MDLSKLFMDTLKAVNPNVVLQDGFPLYDIVVRTLAPALASLQTQADEAEVRYNFANFFNEDGTIKSQEYFDILVQTFFIEFGTDNSTVVVYLLTDTALTEIDIPDDLQITKEGAVFTIAAGLYSDLVPESVSGQYAYRFVATSNTVNNGVTAGTWDTDTYPVGVTGVRSLDPSGGGTTAVQAVTRDNFLTGLSNRGFDNVNAITYNVLNNNLTPEIPQKFTVVQFNTPEYEHVIPVGSTDYFTLSGFADIRLHFGVITSEREVTCTYSAEYSRYIYQFPEYEALYAVTNVVDAVGSAVDFEVDYTLRIVKTYTALVTITFVTTDRALVLQSRTAMQSLATNAMGGTVNVVPFYPLMIYVDATCTDGSVAEVNSALETLITPDTVISQLTLQYVANSVVTATGITISKYLYRMGDNTGYVDAATSLSASSITLFNKTIAYTDRNLVPVGGYE